MAKRPRLTAPAEEVASASAADAATLAFRQLVRAEARALIAEELPQLVEAEVRRQLGQISPAASSGIVVSPEQANATHVVSQKRSVENSSTSRDQGGLDSSVVKLQVGPERKKFTTTVETLSKWESSFFEPLVSGRHTTSRESDGSIFIDRPHKHFGSILNFMQNPYGFQVPASIAVADELRVEAEFYCLEQLICRLRRLRASRLEGGMQVTSDKKDAVTLKGQDHAAAILDIPDPDKFNVTVNFTEETACIIILGVMKTLEADSLGSKLGSAHDWAKSPVFTPGSDDNPNAYYGKESTDFVTLPPGRSKTLLFLNCRRNAGAESVVFGSDNKVLARNQYRKDLVNNKKDRYLSIVFDRNGRQTDDGTARVEFRVKNILIYTATIKCEEEYRPCLFFKGLAEVKVS